MIGIKWLIGGVNYILVVKRFIKVAEYEGVSTEAINKHMNRTKIRLVLEAVRFLDKNIFS